MTNEECPQDLHKTLQPGCDRTKRSTEGLKPEHGDNAASLANYCFKTITYRLVTPSILFFCIADTTPALKRCVDMGA